MTVAKIIAESIATALVQYRFTSEVDAMREENTRLAHLCYRKHWAPEQIALMDTIPDGWLDTTSQVEARTNQAECLMSFGKNYQFKFFASPPPVYVKFPKARQYLETRLIFEQPFAETINDHAQKLSTLTQQIRQAHFDATKVIKSTSTLKRLVASWPEVEPFARQYMNATKPQLPAIRTETLNTQFKLPVVE